MRGENVRSEGTYATAETERSEIKMCIDTRAAEITAFCSSMHPVMMLDIATLYFNEGIISVKLLRL